MLFRSDGAFDTLAVPVTPLIGKLCLHVQGYVDQEDFFISPLKHQFFVGCAMVSPYGYDY